MIVRELTVNLASAFFLTAHFSQEDYPYDWLMHWLSKVHLLCLVLLLPSDITQSNCSVNSNRLGDAVVNSTLQPEPSIAMVSRSQRVAT